MRGGGRGARGGASLSPRGRGRGRARRETSPEIAVGRYSDGEDDPGKVLQGAPWKFRWFSQVGPSPFYFLFSFISFQYLI